MIGMLSWVIGRQLHDSRVQYLGSLTRLTCLGLRDTRIADDALEHLKQMVELEALDLNVTSVGDDGLNALLSLPRLKSLQLYSTCVSDGGFSHVRQGTMLLLGRQDLSIPTKACGRKSATPPAHYPTQVDAASAGKGEFH
jgi:hypothetical protein